MTRSVLSDTTLTHEEMCGEDVTIQDLTHRSFLKKNHHCGYSVGINLHNFLSYRGLSFLVFIAMLPLARYAPETSALQVRPLSPEQGALLRGAATSSITKAQDTEKVISLTAHPIAEPVRLLPIVAPALESNAPLDPEVTVPMLCQ
jgi:hypothetical protein